VKILIDMNIPLDYSKFLKEKEIETIRWSDVGLSNAPDEEIMQYAKANDFIVLTSDLDFSALLSMTHAIKPSIIQTRISLICADRAVDMIISAAKRYSNELAKGAILSINPQKARVRLLPLQRDFIKEELQN